MDSSHADSGFVRRKLTLTELTWFCVVFWSVSIRVIIAGQNFVSLAVENLLMSAPKAYIAYSDSIVTGSRLGIEECGYQFMWEKWNCPIQKPPILTHGAFLPVTRELAFARAICSAGVTYTLTRNCSSGLLQNCQCSGKHRTTQQGKQWTWAGCKESFDFAVRVSRGFLDHKDDSRDAKAFVNLHNNEAGRQSIRRTLTLLCKCHGVSGSCATRTCWKQLPDFRVVGDYLKNKYRRALLADFQNGLPPREVIAYKYNGRPTSGIRAIAIHTGRLKQTSLVYLDQSPDYCRRNGTYATIGRKCVRSRDPNAESASERRSCSTLCRQCGLRVRRTTITVETSCNCKFQWCCSVRCETCVQTRHVLTCSLL